MSRFNEHGVEVSKCFICDGDIVDSSLVADHHMQVNRDGSRGHMRCHRAYWKGVEYARAEMTPKPIVCPRCQERHGHPVHWCHCYRRWVAYDDGQEK